MNPTFLLKRLNALRVRIILIFAAVLVSAVLLTSGVIDAETGSYIVGATALCATTVRTERRRSCNRHEQAHEQTRL